MKRCPFVLALAAAFGTALLAGSACAATIAADSFLIDADPDVGYTAGWAFDNGSSQTQGPDATGMTVANWAYGRVGTGVWKSDGAGLSFAATDGEVGGSALWNAYAADWRNVSRLLDSPVTVSTNDEYWMAVMVQASGTLDTTGTALGGFTDRNAPSGTNPQGYWVGFRDNNLVLGHRVSGNAVTYETLSSGITLDSTYLVIVKSIVNASSSQEALSVWVNPTDVSSEAALGTAVSIANIDQSLFSTAFTQLSFYGDSLGMEVRFDEMALGTSLSDVVTPIPEPATFALATLGLFGLLAFGRRRRR